MSLQSNFTVVCIDQKSTWSFAEPSTFGTLGIKKLKLNQKNPFATWNFSYKNTKCPGCWQLCEVIYTFTGICESQGELIRFRVLKALTNWFTWRIKVCEYINSPWSNKGVMLEIPNTHISPRTSYIYSSIFEVCLNKKHKIEHDKMVRLLYIMSG